MAHLFFREHGFTVWFHCSFKAVSKRGFKARFKAGFKVVSKQLCCCMVSKLVSKWFQSFVTAGFNFV